MSSESDITTHYIPVANAFVTKVYENDTVMTATLLEEVERWLTGHLIAVSRSRTTTSERVGDVSVSYTGSFGEMLKSTPYGQMVLTLDITGKMGRVGKRVASIYAVTSFK